MKINPKAAEAKKKRMPMSQSNFQELAKEHGYIKARQMVLQSTVKLQQERINLAENEQNTSKSPLRLKESARLGSTYGMITQDSIVEIYRNATENAIVTIDPSKYRMDKMNDSTSKSLSDSLTQPISKAIEPPANREETQIFADTLRQSIGSDNGELLIANRDVASLPDGIGQTLFLQLAYIKKLSAPRNNLTSILSSSVPQLSVYHLRYVREMNLSLNKLKSLPADIGLMEALEIADLSNNMLSLLPPTINKLKCLRKLSLASNNLSSLPEEFCQLNNLEILDISSNLFLLLPYALTRLKAIKTLNASKNSLQQLAILPPLNRPEDMWKSVIDRRTGKTVFMNILTKEKVKKIEYYSGRGIQRAADLHEFQAEGSASYRRRKFWLSLCQIHEWEPTDDPITGLTYFKNNVSATTSWAIPKSIDNMGAIQTLQELVITNNSIKTLLASFTKLVNIKKLVLSKNRIYSLPEDFGDLVNLEVLSLESNELKLLPSSFCKCLKLKNVVLKDNHILRLPDEMGLVLVNLERLDLTANHLKQIPFSLGYCKPLTSVIAYENPLVDPPFEEFSKGIDSLKWYLRNRFIITDRGMPPVMRYQKIGIRNEVTVLQPEFNDIVQQMIDVTFKDGMLNLQLLGIKDIPPAVLKIGSKLKKLKLDFNESLQFPDGIPSEFKSLNMLSLKSCKLTEVPESLHRLKHLTSLNCEENRFESLPDEITELVHLTSLDVSKNKLYNLPPGFEYLTNLKTLNFEANNIESLPKGIGRMVELKSLNLAKNRIVDFPDTICDLRSLRVLNMEKNKLLNVPLRIGKLNVIELRIGHNRIESLPEDMFDSSLGKSIKLFSCCENNLMELPSSLSLIDSDGLVDADYNPLVSPPPELLSEGLKVLQNYFRVRQNRKVQIEELLTDEDFEYVPSSAFPVAHEVLEDGTGFLTPGDLAEFDQAIHEYLNGEFYRCPASGEEIVANVNQLRELREVEMYLLILYTFLGIVKQLVTNKDKRFNDANIFEAKRSWGRKGEECNVWCISLNCLLRSTAPNKFHKDGRPSIFSMIKTALPPMVFPFTVDLLKDAIRLYVSPYGQIADTEEITFPHCDCVDEKRGKPKRHDPCVKAAVVIAKSIYVDEEANRREVEEDECLIRFEEIEEDIRIWLGTEEGIGTRETECKRRKALLKEDIKLRDELILSQKLKIKKCEETIKRFMKRKESFDAGEPYENHGYHTVSEPMKAIAAEEAELAKLTERTDLLLSVVAKMKEEYSMDMEVFRRNAANDLVQKYCVENYINFVDNNRRFAARNGLNRYWDGDDGEDFEKWKTAHKHVSVRPSTPGQIVKSRKTPPPIFEEPVQETEEERAAKALEPEYNWEGTHDMKKYKLNIYTRYKAERNISAALLEVLQK